MTSVDAIQKLMTDMGYSYCKLVRKHSMNNHSAPVQKTIIQIDSDLTADLTLHHLAELQSMSSGYLSALFRRETGQTLTDCVNLRRIDFAQHLLKTAEHKLFFFLFIQSLHDKAHNRISISLTVKEETHTMSCSICKKNCRFFSRTGLPVFHCHMIWDQ